MLQANSCCIFDENTSDLTVYVFPRYCYYTNVCSVLMLLSLTVLFYADIHVEYKSLLRIGREIRKKRKF